MIVRVCVYYGLETIAHAAAYTMIGKMSLIRLGIKYLISETLAQLQLQ